MSQVWRWILPNRFDAVMFVVALLICIGYLYSAVGAMPYSSDEFVLWFATPVACTLIAIGSCLGWNCFGLKRTLLLLAVCFACLFLNWIGWLFGWQIIAREHILQSMRWSWGLRFEPEADWFRFENQLWIAGWLVGCFLFSWLLVILFRKVPFWLYSVAQNLFRKTKDRLELTRVKLLIGIAAVLFLVTTTNNILIANGINIFENGDNFDAIEMVISALIGLIFYGVVVVYTSWVFLHGKAYWVKFLILGTLVAVMLIGVFVSRTISQTSMIEMGVWAFSSLIFVISVVGLKDVKTSVRPSIWSFLLVAVSGFLIASPAFFDFNFLFNPHLNVAMEDRIRAAYESGQLKWQTGGQISGTPDVYFCNFNPDGDSADSFEKLDFNSGNIDLAVFQMYPNVKTECLHSVSKGNIALVKTGVTASQLEDIVAGTTLACRVQNLDVDSTQSKAVIDVGSMQIVEDRPGKLKALLESIKEFKNNPTVDVDSKITKEDLPAILKASQSSQIILHGSLPDSDINWSEFSLDKLTAAVNVYYNTNTYGLSPNQIQFLLDTNIQILFSPSYVYGSDQNLEWDLAFACAERFRFAQISTSVSRLASRFDFDDSDQSIFEQNHLVWGKNGQAEITHLFLPSGEFWQDVSKLTSLKSLSYDPKWLNEDTAAPPRAVKDLGSLQGLTNLEELYLSDNTFLMRSLSFLAKMKSLKHLQIPKVDRSMKGTIGFDACPSLESITFLGKPDVASIAELAKLPNLKKVTISSINNGVLNEANAKSVLNKKLPGVEIVILPFGQHQKTIPMQFLVHKEKAQKEAMARLKSLLNSTTNQRAD